MNTGWNTIKSQLAPALPFIIGSLLFIIISIPVATYVLFAKDLGSKESIVNRNDAGITLLDRDGEPFFTFYEAKQKEYTPLSSIPIVVQKAAIASEDKDFYTHPGFSIRGIFRSLFINLQEKTIAQGGSTITQQLVKNTLLTQDRNFVRKYQEIVLASEIERRYSKDQILEMYLNSVYFGEGAFGVEQAAQTYFNKPASQLTLGEAALLIGLLPAPSRLSPLSNDQAEAIKRQKIVLSEMTQQGYISSAQLAAAQNEELQFATKKEAMGTTAPHFALMVKDQLIKRYGEEQVIRSGYKVKTTLNREWQEYAEQAVKNQVGRLAGNNVSNGAAVVIDPRTGEVPVLVGSADWYNEKNGKVNMAVVPRQPGSSFKPIIYAAALENKLITAAIVLEDKPTTFEGGYKPKNYDGKYRGNIPVRFALANSLNIPAVQVMSQVGVQGGIDAAQQFGITTLKDPSMYGLSFVLGSGEVPLTEMTRAYAVFASGGDRVEPRFIRAIYDKDNREIYSSQVDKQSVLDQGVAFIISSILSDNRARSEVFGSALTISRPAAVKTGTTDDYSDSLTLGYTPSIVVGVWVGNNDNESMDNVAGSLGAAPIWKQMMEHYLAGTPMEQFDKPFGVTDAQVCRENSDKKEASSAAYTEYFLSGTESAFPCSRDASPTPSDLTPSPTDRTSPTPTAEDNPPPDRSNRDQKEKDKQDKPTPTDTIITLPTLPIDTPTSTTQQSPTPTP